MVEYLGGHVHRGAGACACHVASLVEDLPHAIFREGDKVRGMDGYTKECGAPGLEELPLLPYRSTA